MLRIVRNEAVEKLFWLLNLREYPSISIRTTILNNYVSFKYPQLYMHEKYETFGTFLRS